LIERAKACGVKTLRLISKDAFLRMAVSTICLSLRIRYESHEDVTTALSTPIT
jgi:hypothetical protein